MERPPSRSLPAQGSGDQRTQAGAAGESGQAGRLPGGGGEGLTPDGWNTSLGLIELRGGRAWTSWLLVLAHDGGPTMFPGASCIFKLSTHCMPEPAVCSLLRVKKGPVLTRCMVRGHKGLRGSQGNPQTKEGVVLQAEAGRAGDGVGARGGPHGFLRG
jgi:hypothetical protein